MAREHKRLGDLLIEAGLITPGQLDEAIAEQRRTGQLLGATLVRLGRVTETDLVQCLHGQLGLPVANLDDAVVDEAVLVKLSEELARRYTAMPLEIEGRKTLVVAMADPLNVAALEDLRFHCNLFIRPVLAAPSQIEQAIERYYHIDRSMNEVITQVMEGDELVVAPVTEEQRAETVDVLLKESEGRPIVRLTNWLLHRAVEERASDIHIEPQDRDLVVRLRVDGLLHERQRLPKWTQGPIVSRIKVLSNLDIAEKRMPQDGRLTVEIRGRRVDMRVSTLPVSHGEKVVIRVTDRQTRTVELDHLGMQADDLGRLRRMLDRPQGIVLVTGPTGSGKTTLLYSALRHVQDETKNIVTVEDPVEFQLRGINQVQVDEKAKKSFPSALRAILRQDPDVIMIGEIRDKETAQIAFRASVTVHLVLSTVHTNDAAGAVTRLIDLGLEPFMVASSLLGVVSMRLVRTLCPRCRESYTTDAASLDRLVAGPRGPELTLWRGRGCAHCLQTGYLGRTGIYELLLVDDTIRRQVVSGAPDSQIRQTAIENGMRTIGEDGLAKVKSGATTLDEVTRMVYLAEQTLRSCPSCAAALGPEFDFCPSCGGFVGEHCRECKRRLQPDWTFCAFCGTDARDRLSGPAGLVTPTDPVPRLREAS